MSSTCTCLAAGMCWMGAGPVLRRLNEEASLDSLLWLNVCSPKLVRIRRRVSLFFLVSLPKRQISVIQARLLWCIFIYLVIFASHFGTSTMSFWFVPVHRFRRHTLMFLLSFCPGANRSSAVCRSLWHFQGTTHKQTSWLKMKPRQDITPSKARFRPLRCQLCTLWTQRDVHACARASHLYSSRVTYAHSCSDRIISAPEHFASPKPIRSPGFVFTSYSCQRSRCQSVLMSNWAELLACFTLMMHSEQRKAFLCDF